MTSLGWVLFMVLSIAQPAEVREGADDVAFRIGKQLRCPVCQGMPIAESPATMARDMMVLVREQVASGQSEEAVKAYFVQRYGEWVLLNPPAHGFNVLLWALPAAILVGGTAWFILSRQRAQQRVTAPRPATRHGRHPL